MSIIIKGGASGDLVSVDTNKNLNVNLPLSAETAGFASMLAENDSGEVTGTRYVNAVEVSADFRVRTGIDQTVFNELFPGSAVNTGLWSTPVTTQTLTIGGGFANLNAASSIAINAVSRLTTYRSFPCYKSYTTYVEMECQFTSLPIAGNVCEWGLLISTGTAVPTDGVFFRLNSAGEFRAVINYNGVETVSTPINFSTLVGINTSRGFLIYVISNKALFWVDNKLVATIEAPATQGTTTASMNLPLSFRNYNSTAVSTAQIMKVSMVNVTMADQNTNKLWSHILCGAGGHSSQGQTGGVLGTTSLYTNSLAAGTGAAMTNTTAALGSGLGGQFSVLPTLAVGTDGIISSFQVPLGTASLPGKSLYITRVTISSAVTTILAGGPVLYAYSLAYGHNAVSLATTESATSKAPRRLPLGMQTLPATAAVGTIGTLVDVDFNSPIVVYPGEFVQLVGKNLGVVTTTGVVTFLVSIGGYWE